LRGLAERILIVCPANLSLQWQRELKEKFDEKFLSLKGGDIKAQFGVNQMIGAAEGHHHPPRTST
jgi:SNF2 family DNA or RNA helicase